MLLQFFLVLHLLLMPGSQESPFCPTFWSPMLIRGCPFVAEAHTVAAGFLTSLRRYGLCLLSLLESGFQRPVLALMPQLKEAAGFSLVTLPADSLGQMSQF